MNRILIKDYDSEVVNKGDRLELHFNIIPFFKTWQINKIKEALNNDGKYKVLDTRRDDDTLIVLVEVL